MSDPSQRPPQTFEEPTAEQWGDAVLEHRRNLETLRQQAKKTAEMARLQVSLCRQLVHSISRVCAVHRDKAVL